MASGTIPQISNDTGYDSQTGIHWCKMPDGTLIQWGKLTGINFSNATMVEGEISLPVSYNGTGYSVTANAASTSNNDYIMRVACNASSANKFAWTMGSGSGSAITVNNRQINWIAVGRWK